MCIRDSAYILASLANKTSQVDVEQILGRILRLPHTSQHTQSALNMSLSLIHIFVIQTADARAFFQFDFCATLLLDLLAHDSAPFWGWILYSQKGKYLCPIGAQQISCF